MRQTVAGTHELICATTSPLGQKGEPELAGRRRERMRERREMGRKEGGRTSSFYTSREAPKRVVQLDHVGRVASIIQQDNVIALKSGGGREGRSIVSGVDSRLSPSGLMSCKWTGEAHHQVLPHLEKTYLVVHLVPT